MVRWALGVRPGGEWLESKLDRLVDQKGFRLQAWNRLPQAKPTLTVAARDVGLSSEADVLRVQLSGPAFRQPAEFEVTGTADTLALNVSQPAKVRLAYRLLRPDWPADNRPDLRRQGPGGNAEDLGTGSDVVWENGQVEWEAGPGRYELRTRPR